MPLHEGHSEETISENISELVNAGHPQKQAVAIAMKKSREDEEATAPGTGRSGRAAGILFHTPDGELLFMHRGNGGDYPRTWGLPGGHQEDGEDLEACARREAMEETGYNYTGPLAKLADDGYFCTYAAKIDAKFDVRLCDESTGFSWAKATDAPAPLHPNLNTTLRIFGAKTELAVAELIRDGVLPSPQIFANILLVDLRITGTGVAYRTRYKEHVWRDPQLYLTDEFLRRCNGLVTILDHPESSILNSEEFEKRICGTVFVPYIKGDEVWAIAKIYTNDAIEDILEGEISTSPGVVFGDPKRDNIKASLENGEIVLIEGNPALIDHIAIVTKRRGSLGVWDKGGPPAGVSLNNEELIMADEAKKADADPMAAVMDALAKMDKKIDDNAKKMDDMGKRLDAAEEGGKAKEAIVDKAKKDAEEAEKKKADEEKAKADAEAAAEKAKNDAQAAEADAATCADAQHRADAVYAALGETAPRRMDGERSMAYRVRLLGKLKAHSPAYKDINLASINDSAVLSIAETTIYNDAVSASRRPLDFGAPSLREIVKPSRTGHTIIEFAGDSRAWLSDFMLAPKCIAFNSPRNRSM